MACKTSVLHYPIVTCHVGKFRRKSSDLNCSNRLCNYCSSYLYCQLYFLQVQFNGPRSALDSLIDQGPYVNLTDGMVSAMGNEPTPNNIVEETPNRPIIQDMHTSEMASGEVLKHRSTSKSDYSSDAIETNKEAASIKDVKSN